MCSELPEDQTTITLGGPGGVNTSPLSLYLEREIRARGLECNHESRSEPGPSPPPLTTEERARYLDILARAQSHTEPVPDFDEVVFALFALGLHRPPDRAAIAAEIPVLLFVAGPGGKGGATLMQQADGTVVYFHLCLNYGADDVLRLRLPLSASQVETLLDRIVSDAKLGAEVVARRRARMAGRGERMAWRGE
jgi:hypothetical protein